MAAIDEIKSALADSNNRLDSLRAQKARHQGRIDLLNAMIDAEVAKKEGLRLAARDLGDEWTPAR